MAELLVIGLLLALILAVGAAHGVLSRGDEMGVLIAQRSAPGAEIARSVLSPSESTSPRCDRLCWRKRTADLHDGSCYRWPKIRRHARRIDGVMQRFGGPLAGYGHEIACAAKRYNVSPYLIIAIAGTESTFGKAACGFNPFGLGSCVGTWSTRFENYAEAIWYEARLLGERYIGRGLNSVEEIGHVYATSSHWPTSTRRIMRMFTSSEQVTW